MTDYNVTIDNAGLTKAGKLSGTLQLWDREHDRVTWGVMVKDFDAEGVVAGLVTEIDAWLKDPAETLETVIREARAAVEERQNGTHAMSAIARVKVSALTDVGRFLETPRGRFFFDPDLAAPIELESERMLFVMRKRLNIGGGEEILKHVLAEANYHTAERGERAELHEFAHYDSDAGVIYMSEQPGMMLRIAGDGVTRLQNGEDGVMFVEGDAWQPWKYTQADPDDWRLMREVIETIAWHETDGTGLTPKEQQLLYLWWMMAVLFRDAMPTRPLLVIVGETESGKSTAVRMAGRILLGRDFELDSLDSEREDQFWDALGNRPLVAWDDLNTRVRWLEGALATVATGIQRSKRKLYTDAEMVRHRPRPMLALTAHTPNFRRPDVANRAIVLNTQKRDDQALAVEAEDTLWRRIADSRDVYLSELVDRARQALAVPMKSNLSSPLRIADLYAVWWRIATSTDQIDELDTIATKLRGAQTAFAAEEHPVFLAVQAWMEGVGPDGRDDAGVKNALRELTARQLFTELQEIAKAAGFKWYTANHLSMGHTFRDLATAFTAANIGIEKGFIGPRGHRSVSYKLRWLDEADPTTLL